MDGETPGPSPEELETTDLPTQNPANLEQRTNGEEESKEEKEEKELEKEEGREEEVERDEQAKQERQDEELERMRAEQSAEDEQRIEEIRQELQELTDQNKDVSKRFTLSKEEFAVDRVEAIKNTMDEIKSEHPEVLSMTLFGSMVRGDAKEASDIDGYLFVDAGGVNGQTQTDRFDNTVFSQDIQAKYQDLARLGLKEKSDLADEQVKDVLVLPISREIIDEEIGRLLPYAQQISEYRKAKAEAEISGRDILDEDYPRHPDSEQWTHANNNLSSMFHLAVGKSIEKYRGYLLDKLKTYGTAGEVIWEDIVGSVKFMEQGKSEKPFDKYPKTIQDAERIYGVNK